MRIGEGNQSMELGAFDDDPEAVTERNDKFDLDRFQLVVVISEAVRIPKLAFLFERTERGNFALNVFGVPLALLR